MKLDNFKNKTNQELASHLNCSTATIIRKLRKLKHNIKIVFVAPQFSQKSAKTISQNIGANVVSIDPLSDDWKNNLIFVDDE